MTTKLIQHFSTISLRNVDLAEISTNEYNLNITRYVDIAEPEEQLDVAEELRKLRELETERKAAEDRMNRLLVEIGFEG